MNRRVWFWVLAVSLCAFVGCDDSKGGTGTGPGEDGPLPERDVIQVGGQLEAEFVGAGPPAICDWGDGRVVINLRVRDNKGDEASSRVVLPNAESADGQRMDALMVDGALTLEADSRLVVPRFEGQVCGGPDVVCPEGYTCANTNFCERPASFTIAPGSVRFVPSRVSFQDLSVALLVDESAAVGMGDMAQDPAGDRHFAVKAFINALAPRFPGVEVALYTFGGEGREGVTQVVPYTRDTNLLAGTAETLASSGGQRPLFDAMKIASDHMALEDRRNTVMVIITGGPDTSSGASIDELDAALVDVPLFIVHLGGVSTSNQTLPDDELIRLTCRLSGNYYYELQSSLLRRSVVLVSDIIDGVWQVELEASGLLIDPKAFTTLSATLRINIPELSFAQTLEFEGGAQGFFGNRLFLPYR